MTFSGARRSPFVPTQAYYAAADDAGDDAYYYAAAGDDVRGPCGEIETFSSRHRIRRLSGLVSEGPTVGRTVPVHGTVAPLPSMRPRAVEEDVGSPPLFTVGSPRRPRPTTTTRPRMIARTATTTQRTHTGTTTPTVTPSAQNQILSRRVSVTAQSRPPRHQRDASSMARRCGLPSLDSACATAFSPRKDLVKNYRARPTHRFARRLCGG